MPDRSRHAGGPRRAQQGHLSIYSAGPDSALLMGGVMLRRALGDGGELVTDPGGGAALEDLHPVLLDVMLDRAIIAMPATSRRPEHARFARAQARARHRAAGPGLGGHARG